MGVSLYINEGNTVYRVKYMKYKLPKDAAEIRGMYRTDSDHDS